MTHLAPEIALEIHDAGLVAVAWPEGGTPQVIGIPSPGYAVWEGRGDVPVITGIEARKRAWLAPRRAHHRFWHALDAHTPLPRPFPRGWTPADLAHAHLEAVRGGLQGELERVTDSFVLAVPGSFDPRQLGLLLGVCAAAGLPVSGLVDLAVAAATATTAATAATATTATTATATADGVWNGPDAAGPRRAVHFDLHLHRTVITELAVVGDGSVIRRDVERVDIGRIDLEDTWARHLAAAFVRSTRFDPLHAAATEQSLYQRLPTWLEALSEDREAGDDDGDGETGELPFALHLGGEERAVEIPREAAVDAVSGLYRRITEPLRSLAGRDDPGATALLLSPTATGLPGLTERLEALGYPTVIPLPAGAAGRGALAAREAICTFGEERAGVPLTLRLPFPARSLHGAA